MTFDLVVLGGGTAGLVAAHTAAALGARVALVESGRTGGDCLWTGCVPSKTLLAAADLAQRMRTADDVGLEPVTPTIDLSSVADRIRAVQSRIEPHDSPERLRSAGVEVFHGRGRFEASGRIRVDGEVLTTRAAILATGSRPVLPPVEGLREADPLTTETVWDALPDLPERILILGGGPVGFEIAQGLARLGRSVTLVEIADRCLREEEADASELLTDVLVAEGVDVRTGTRVSAVRDISDGWVAETTDGEKLPTERIIAATGRRATTDRLGLDAVGARTRDDGAVVVDRMLRTSARGVYAAGDVTGILPFTHVAAAHGVTATLNAVFLARRTVAHDAMPWVTFTDPEVARVGITSDTARQRWGADATVADLPLDRVDRALTDGRPEGFVRLVGDRRGRLHGATVVAARAGEVIAGLADTVRRGEPIAKITATVHPYPTYAIGAYQAAGEHVRERWATPRTRGLVKPLLLVLRVLSGLRSRRHTGT